MNALAQLNPIRSGVYHWAELPVKKEGQREGRKIAEGTTHEFEYLEMHATTQEKGAIPRPPHMQDDIEEILIIKEGKVKCTIGDKSEILGPGSVILIPPLESQTFENIGDGPLIYYVFMFRSKLMSMERSRNAGGFLLIHGNAIPSLKTNTGHLQKYFNRPTAMCENFEVSLVTMDTKGPAHALHSHADTEIILVTEGITEMVIDGKKLSAGPGDLYMIESGQPYHILNTADKPCRYLILKWR